MLFASVWMESCNSSSYQYTSYRWEGYERSRLYGHEAMDSKHTMVIDGCGLGTRYGCERVSRKEVFNTARKVDQPKNFATRHRTGMRSDRFEEIDSNQSIRTRVPTEILQLVSIISWDLYVQIQWNFHRCLHTHWRMFSPNFSSIGWVLDRFEWSTNRSRNGPQLPEAGHVGPLTCQKWSP